MTLLKCKQCEGIFELKKEQYIDVKMHYTIKLLCTGKKYSDYCSCIMINVGLWFSKEPEVFLLTMMDDISNDLGQVLFSKDKK